MSSETAVSLRLRLAETRDWARLLAWRNDARAQSVDTREIQVADHFRWLTGVLERTDVRLWIVTYNDAPAGYVRADSAHPAVSLSIALDGRRRSSGIGTHAVALAITAAYKQWPTTAQITARVRVENYASLRMFAANGFVPSGETVGGLIDLSL